MLRSGSWLEGDGRIDLATGQVWPDAAFEHRDVLSEEEDDEFEDPDKRLWVRWEGYRDMERFIETVTDPDRPTGLA